MATNHEVGSSNLSGRAISSRLSKYSSSRSANLLPLTAATQLTQREDKHTGRSPEPSAGFSSCTSISPSRRSIHFSIPSFSLLRRCRNGARKRGDKHICHRRAFDHEAIFVLRFAERGSKFTSPMKMRVPSTESVFDMQTQLRTIDRGLSGCRALPAG